MSKHIPFVPWKPYGLATNPLVAALVRRLQQRSWVQIRKHVDLDLKANLDSWDSFSTEATKIFWKVFSFVGTVPKIIPLPRQRTFESIFWRFLWIFCWIYTPRASGCNLTRKSASWGYRSKGFFFGFLRGPFWGKSWLIWGEPQTPYL